MRDEFLQELRDSLYVHRPLPLGVETLGNEDIPCWPQNNNATFREVWVGAAARWMLLCADCMTE